jgi:hypothetical protein
LRIGVTLSIPRLSAWHDVLESRISTIGASNNFPLDVTIVIDGISEG